MEPCMDVPMLQAACLVTRYCLPEGSGDLPHVTQQLDAYLDIFSSNWTIVKAYQRTRNLRCVQFVATRESAETQDPFFKRWLLNRTAESAASCKDLPTIHWLMENYLPEETVDNVAEIAGTLGHLEILQWLYDHQRDRVIFEGALCGALENCHEHVVSWLLGRVELRVEIREDVLRSTVEGGNLDMIRWLCDDCGLNASDMLENAINRCQTETARWIIEKYDISNQTVNWYSLARDGKLSFLKYLVSRNIGMPGTALATFVIKKKLLPAAARNGHLDVVKWLHCQQGYNLTVGAMKEAARHGQLAVVQWLFRKSRSLCNNSVLGFAAQNGQLEVLQWLESRWTGNSGALVMETAARIGRLDVVKAQYGRRKGDYSREAVDKAASWGHLEVVKWLSERQMECTTNAMDGAAGSGHLDIVKWLHEHRTEGCSTMAMNHAAGNGHLHVVKWLNAYREEGCTSEAMDRAAAQGHLNVVQWLHHYRTEGCTSNAMDWAAQNGHLNVVKWLQDHRSEGCTSAAMNFAALNGHLHVIKWLHTHRSEGCPNKALENALMHDHFDVVLFLHQCKTDFQLPTSLSLSLSREVHQWLLANYAGDMRGFNISVFKPNRRTLTPQPGPIES